MTTDNIHRAFVAMIPEVVREALHEMLQRKLVEVNIVPTTKLLSAIEAQIYAEATSGQFDLAGEFPQFDIALTEIAFPAIR